MSELACRDDVISAIRLACIQAGGQKQWALANQISPQYVCDVINGKRLPGKSILKAAGFEFFECYKRKEPTP